MLSRWPPRQIKIVLINTKFVTKYVIVRLLSSKTGGGFNVTERNLHLNVLETFQSHEGFSDVGDTVRWHFIS